MDHAPPLNQTTVPTSPTAYTSLFALPNTSRKLTAVGEIAFVHVPLVKRSSVPLVPTANQTPAPAAHTAFRLSPGTDVDVVAHVLPVSRTATPLLPTAKALVALSTHTSCKLAFVLDDAACQLVPFHTRIFPPVPTAITLVLLLPCSASSVVPNVEPCADRLQVVPLYRYTSPREFTANTLLLFTTYVDTMFSIIAPAKPVVVQEFARRAPTLTVSATLLDGSATEVAVTIAAPFVMPVTTPLFTVAIAGALLFHVTAVDTRGSAVTVATSVAELPAVTVRAGAESVMLTGRENVVNATDADFVLSTNDVAVTFTPPTDTAVTTPLALTVAIAVLLLDQPTVCDTPASAVTTAASVTS